MQDISDVVIILHASMDLQLCSKQCKRPGSSLSQQKAPGEPRKTALDLRGCDREEQHADRQADPAEHPVKYPVAGQNRRRLL